MEKRKGKDGPGERERLRDRAGDQEGWRAEKRWEDRGRASGQP